jgi:hypothetical protein
VGFKRGICVLPAHLEGDSATTAPRRQGKIKFLLAKKYGTLNQSRTSRKMLVVTGNHTNVKSKISTYVWWQLVLDCSNRLGYMHCSEKVTTQAIGGA